ncbi:hypothetical protein QYE76_033343 [Lolium multiflorum]|uniref:Uncharacterized protein n=1 Tax=Lolium multiflorum TaxID=4521 RepID=A0AAD8QWH1_LOLMU|nr:hypothetical protein QYE76_033343 [Lolium multiflorum]
MARVHPMWVYSGPKYETSINIAELSEKELLDEVRRLTLFSQEDSIPLISSYTPLDADHPLTEIPIVPENLHDLPNDTSEGRGSSTPVDFHTAEHDDPIDSEAVFADPPSPVNDTCDTAGSVRDDNADHDAFINAAVEEVRAPPVKRSTGGFADEDDLFNLDEGLIEPRPRRPNRRCSAGRRFEASALQPPAQISTASSLSKGKDIPSLSPATPSGKTDMRGVISSLEAFASQFTSLEADKVRVQKEVSSSSLKLEDANKIAAAARQEVDSPKEELSKLKERLKEEEASRLVAEARVTEKDELLRQSSLALLEAANIPADALDKVPNNSPANSVSMTLAAHQLTRELLDKGKGAMARMHSMIFPKINQDKTLGQLIDAFAVDTKEVIEVFPVPSFVDDSSGALPEGDRIQRMKDRIAQMEKDLRSTYALAAIVRKKGEIAADVERYALTELHKATESLNFIALNRAEENKRIHERVNALTQLSSAEEIFWKEQFQDRVQPVHHFFDKCYKALRVIWKTMFPLNAVPPTLLTLMSEFGNTKKIRDLVRAQVTAASAGRKTPERKELSGGQESAGKFPPGGEIDAIVTVIELDIISITIVIIFIIITAVSTAHRHRRNDLGWILIV